MTRPKRLTREKGIRPHYPACAALAIRPQIFALALPALGALAAEPTYLLVDTAIVGHLGTVQLAALALAAAILGVVVSLCNFLAYGTTSQVARQHGAGREREAGETAAQALWLALAIALDPRHDAGARGATR